MHTVTIVARNYLPRARVLARTYRQHNPDDEFSILVVDAEPGEVSAGTDHEVVVPSDLPLAADEFDRMALIYSVTELCTALKPWALELLLDRGAEVATYLDPDIAVYGSLETIEKLSLEHGIVLTPHTVEPIPRDGLSPTEADIMAAGTFNLGFLAVGAGSRDMLHWWQERLRRDCIIAPQEMLFVDQRWVDLVPGYFDHVVLTDPTYNVAYWNLDTRELVRAGDVVEVADHGPLRFFHFSGYEPDRPWVLCKYHVDSPRVVMSEHPVVRELCDEYAAWITDAAVGGSPGSAVDGTPYGFDRLRGGLQVTASMRTELRRALIRSEETGSVRPPGWRDEAEVLAWFREPVEVGSGTNRYLYSMWESREDLRTVFPAPLWRDSDALVDWAWTASRTEPVIVIDLLPPRPESHAALPLVSDVNGVNLAGYFTAELGMGELGRMLVDGVRAAGLPFSTSTNSMTLSRQIVPFDGSADRACYPVTVAAVNADAFPRWAQDSGFELRRGYTIGLWAWEVEEFPRHYDDALALVDEVWTLSAFARDAIARATDKPVHVIPLPVREPSHAGELDRAALGLPEGPYFLFAFDFLSIFERKNPLGVLEAHCRAFPDSDGPTLVLKSMNGQLCRTDREQLRRACLRRRDVVLLEQHLDGNEMSALMAGCAAYVSLHRSEGYGLTMAEAMARGRPVIATAYSGNVDFMAGSNSLLVPHRLVAVPVGAGPYPVTTHWAEPDLDVAAQHLRWVAEHPEDAARLGDEAAQSIRRHGDLQLTADFIAARVEHALSRVPTVKEPVEQGPSRADKAIKKARRLVRAPAVGEQPPALAGPVGRLRRGLHHRFEHHDQIQQERLRATLTATGAVAKRADRALRIAIAARTELGRVTEDATTLSSIRAELDARAVQLSEFRSELAVLRSGVDNEARSAKEVGAHLRALDQTVRAVAADVIALTEHVQTLTGDAAGSLSALRDEVTRLDVEQTATPYTSTETGLRQAGGDGSVFLGFAAGGPTPSFDDLFRGSEEFILERMRAYAPLLAHSAPVLDVGCGRGELLRVLGEAGVECRGVDLDERVVARAREHAVRADVGDGLAELVATEPASLGAVVAVQVVEHLAPEALRELFEAAHQAIRPGGTLIVETVNPHSPAALKAFWLDLTHVRPLYPESLLMLARDCGFASARIQFTFGSGDLDDDLRHCGEYALVATR